MPMFGSFKRGILLICPALHVLQIITLLQNIILALKWFVEFSFKNICSLLYTLIAGVGIDFLRGVQP